jgi:two-component system, NtrC family, response regulator
MATLLIIDDELTICDIICRFLVRKGHQAESAHTLADGLQMVSAQAFDVVFLDVSLPDGDGLSALPRILEAPSRPEAIIITGQGDADGDALAMKNGAWGYVRKPFTIEQIALIIKGVLKYREGKKHPR